MISGNAGVPPVTRGEDAAATLDFSFVFEPRRGRSGGPRL